MSTPDEPTAVHCSRCGQALEPGARFCPNCGLRVGADGVGEEPDETVVMPPPVTRGVREEEVAPAPYAMPEERPWPWGWILAILAALIALLILALIIQELDDDGGSTDTTTTSQVPTTTETTTQRQSVTTQRQATTEPAPATTEPAPATTAEPPTTAPVTLPPTSGP